MMNTAKSLFQLTLMVVLSTLLIAPLSWGMCPNLPQLGPTDFSLSANVETLKTQLTHLQEQIAKRGLTCNFNYEIQKWYRYGKMTYVIPTQLSKDPRESVKITISQGIKPIVTAGSLPAPANRKSFTVNACAISYSYTDSTSGRERGGIFFTTPKPEYDCLFATP